MPEFAGLRTDLTTWIVFAATVLCWLGSLHLIPNWRRNGWPAILQSVYGIVWLDFGLDILLRFAMLAYNAVEWGNGTPRLVALSPDIVNTTLIYSGAFWVLVTLAYAVAVRRRGAGPLAVTSTISPDFAYSIAVPFSMLASIGYYLAETGRLPLAVLTPVVLLSSLYLVPAVVVWWDHFRRPGPLRRIGSLQAMVLLPAIVRGVVSPYRENLAPIVLIPLTAALFAGRRPRLTRLVPLGLVCLLLFSIVVQSYRKLKWEGVRAEELSSEMRQDGLTGWISVASGEPVHRFHGFDSFLLTAALVPSLEPHTGRNVLASALLRGILPRAIYSGKAGTTAGFDFGTQIWAYDNPISRQTGGASIAPSMPGDLYHAGGLRYIVLGALIWGTLLGLVDGWKAYLPAFAGAAVTVLVMTQCAMSVERDFDNSVATFMQTVLVFVVVAWVASLVRREEPQYSRWLRPGLERS